MNDLENPVVLDFNMQTGEITNEVNIPNIPKTYGMYYGCNAFCWSASGQKLYVGKYRNGNGGGKLYQYDLSTGTTNLVYNVNEYDIQLTARGLKMGPDGKIYFLYGPNDGSGKYIAAINKPDNPVGTCDFNPIQIDMGAPLGNTGIFPTFVYTSNSIRSIPNTTITILKRCNQLTSVDTLINLSLNTKDIDNDNLSYVISKIKTKTATIYLTNGSLTYKNTAVPPYSDTLTIRYCDDYCIKKCGEFQLIIYVKAASTSMNLPLTTSACKIPVLLDAGAGYINYNWSTGEKKQSIQVEKEGMYYVTAEDANDGVSLANSCFFTNATSYFYF